MKKDGILNAQLMKNIALLGHMDLFMIGDAGMPIPRGVEIVDLVLNRGNPGFKQVLDAIVAETEVEYYYMAEEIVKKNQVLYQYVTDKMKAVDYKLIPHSDLKELSKKCKFAIRTGEFSPYPNVIFRAGVIF